MSFSRPEADVRRGCAYCPLTARSRHMTDAPNNCQMHGNRFWSRALTECNVASARAGRRPRKNRELVEATSIYKNGHGGINASVVFSLISAISALVAVVSAASGRSAWIVG